MVGLLLECIRARLKNEMQEVSHTVLEKLTVHEKFIIKHSEYIYIYISVIYHLYHMSPKKTGILFLHIKLSCLQNPAVVRFCCCLLSLPRDRVRSWLERSMGPSQQIVCTVQPCTNPCIID